MDFKLTSDWFAMKLKSLLLALLLIPASIMVFAQKNGYDIRIKIGGIPAEKVFLVGYFGLDTWVADSAVVAKDGSFFFRSKTALPKGFYHVVGTDDKEYLEIVVDKTSHFSISTDMENLRVKREIKKSPENTAFFEFQKATLMTVLTPASRETVYRSFADMSPNSLLSLFLNAMSRPSEAARADTFFLCNHYFDNIRIDDERLLRVPMVTKKVIDYFDILPLHPDSMVKYVDLFLQKIENKEVKDYYLAQLFKYYNNYIPNYDVVLVHLYDTYCQDGSCGFIDAGNKRIIAKRVSRARKLMRGSDVPAITAYNAEGQLVNTSEIKSKYLLVWVWDPDCDDCIELTPKLHSLYEQYAAKYDFEVFAFALTDDFDQWQNFVTANNLSWINTSLAGGDSNYDVQDYFDIMTTPFALLLDKNHRVVAKQFTLEQLLPLLK